MMDVLLWKLDECGCKCVTYADELLLIVEGQSRVEYGRKQEKDCENKWDSYKVRGVCEISGCVGEREDAL